MLKLNKGPSGSQNVTENAPLTLHGEESLVIDGRGQQSPSEQVEERLVQLLHRNPLTISQARGRSLCRDRSQFSPPE